MARNIVLITIDSLRADFCPWLTECDFQSLTLTSASESGISFSRAVAPGHATPTSMRQIFTGHTLPELNSSQTGESPVAYHDTIPSILSRQGYSTIGFSPNPFTSRRFGYDDFDIFEDFLERNQSILDMVRSFSVSHWDSKIGAGLRLGLNLVGRGDVTVGWREYYDDVLSAVNETEQPFFLWVFLMETHWPYVPSKYNREGIDYRDFLVNYKRSRVSSSEITNKDRKSLLKLYKNTIKDVDDFVNQLQTDLAEYDPYYILHSDHGESFGEHGKWGHEGPVYEENVHVPLIVWNTDISKDVSKPVSLRQMPAIIQHLVSENTEQIPEMGNLYARAIDIHGDVSLFGRGWFHYPTKNNKSFVSGTSELREIIQMEREMIEEETRIRKAVKHHTP